MRYLLVIIFSLLLLKSYSQTNTASPKKDHYIQVSGTVVGDSLVGLPFVSVLVKGKPRTITDYVGFFSLVVQPGDEIQFMSINHQNASYKLEDTLSLKHYFIIQRMIRDTFQLQTVDVYPWPSKEEFKNAFLNLDLTETDYERAAKNLSREQLTYGERNMRMDAHSNYKVAMQQYLTKVYTTGQYPVNNLLNPVAWAKFIDAWRSGAYKSKKKTQ